MLNISSSWAPQEPNYLKKALGTSDPWVSLESLVGPVYKNVPVLIFPMHHMLNISIYLFPFHSLSAKPDEQFSHKQLPYNHLLSFYYMLGHYAKYFTNIISNSHNHSPVR